MDWKKAQGLNTYLWIIASLSEAFDDLSMCSDVRLHACEPLQGPRNLFKRASVRYNLKRQQETPLVAVLRDFLSVFKKCTNMKKEAFAMDEVHKLENREKG